jgi:hypothetical protein
VSNASCCQPALLCDIYAVNSCLCPPLLVSCMQCVVGGRGGGQGVCLVVSPALAGGGGENTLEYAVCAPSAICVFLALLTPGHSTHAGRTSELRLSAPPPHAFNVCHSRASRSCVHCSWVFVCYLEALCGCRVRRTVHGVSAAVAAPSRKDTGWTKQCMCASLSMLFGLRFSA